MFFVISGYLFFLRQDDGFTWAQYKAKMLRKCKILLLPFFIWNILGALSYPSRFIDATLTEKLLGFWSQRMEWGSWDAFQPFHLLDNKANRNLVHSRNVGLAIFH